MGEIKSHVDMLVTQSIRVDDGLQTREAINQETVASYAEQMYAGAEFPPLVVYFDTTDYWLSEGFHRIAAALKIGLGEISCEIRLGGRREAFRNALGSNAKHGLMRTNADKRKAVTMALADPEFGGFSDNLLAELCAVNQTTVSKIRDELARASVNGKPDVEKVQNTENSETLTQPEPQKRVGRDGKKYTVKPRASSGKATADAPRSGAECVINRNGKHKPDDTKPAEPAAEVLRDGLGVPVPEGLIPVFKHSLVQFDAILSHLRACKPLIGDLAEIPGGEGLQTVLHLKRAGKTADGEDRSRWYSEPLRQVELHVIHHRPYSCTCPYCHHKRQAGEKVDPKCPACRGLSWVTEATFNSCPPEMQAAVKELAR